MFNVLAVLMSSLDPAMASAPPISAGASVTVGFGATFDGNPATVRIGIQGEVPLVKDEELGLGLVLPVEFTTSGAKQFGFSPSNALFTFVPSVRVRVFNDDVVRFYGDAGIGVAYVTANSDGWLFDPTRYRTGWATPTVLGLEIGPPEGGIAVMIEPLGIDTLHFGSRHAAGYAARLGVGVRY